VNATFSVTLDNSEASSNCVTGGNGGAGGNGAFDATSFGGAGGSPATPIPRSRRIE